MNRLQFANPRSRRGGCAFRQGFREIFVEEFCSKKPETKKHISQGFSGFSIVITWRQWFRHCLASDCSSGSIDIRLHFLWWLPMAKKPVKADNFTFEHLAESIRQAHKELVAQTSRAINVGLTLRNWLIGCYIAEYELNGSDRAEYGAALLDNLSLIESGVKGCARRQLYSYLRFYKAYPQIVQSVTAQFKNMLPGSCRWRRISG